MKPSILVLDGEQRAALAVVRSLGGHGVKVHVASSVPHSLAGGSRFATTESLVPEPIEGGEGYATAIARLSAELETRIVLPVTEASIMALLEYRDLLGSVRIVSSDLERFRLATDKAAVLSLAAQLGIDVPAQWVIAGARDVAQIPEERYPLVVKPARSVVTGDDGGRRKVTVQYANDRADLEAIIGRLGPDAGPFLLQTRIGGPGVGIFLLRWKGRVLASFAHRRIREKPPSGGVSVCCESIAAPPDLLGQSIRLLEALDWDGIAMVEYKQDRRTGRYYLMEINPRFWGSLQLAIDSGVDFPWYLYQAVAGDQLPSIDRWKIGRRSRWWWGEVDHLVTRLRHSASDLHLPPDAPGLFSAALQTLSPWRRLQKSDVFRWTDPRPAWRETVAWFQEII
jgi:predicted ATP-grasp superfamily ATP-dependent carboligase